MKKDAQEARLIELSKPELIKVVAEVASEAGSDPKALRNMKGGKEFLKNQDAEFKNFKFGDFSVSEWDELSVIIPKKKNKVVNELMTSLSNRYERLKEIPGEFGSNPSLPLPEQVHSLPSSQNRKAIELGPKFHIASLECNHSPLKDV
ncbi:hypothetical protein Tco_1218924 [Tanacetum coccineum]